MFYFLKELSYFFIIQYYSSLIIITYYHQYYYECYYHLYYSYIFCLAPDGTLCSLPLADVGFVMDVSNHITKDNLGREKEIVKKLVKLFNVKLGRSRAGLMTFNDNATTLLGIGEKASASEFTQTVNSITIKGT